MRDGDGWTAVLGPLPVRHHGRATAGCVAVDRRSLTALLRWLDPAAAPLIAVG